MLNMRYFNCLDAGTAEKLLLRSRDRGAVGKRMRNAQPLPHPHIFSEFKMKGENDV